MKPGTSFITSWFHGFLLKHVFSGWGAVLLVSGLTQKQIAARLGVSESTVQATLSAAWSYYKNWGNRPNSIILRDAITPWIAAGSPTGDPVTSTVTRNGA